MLVSDAVTETRKTIDKIPTDSAARDALVVPRVLKLINVTLPALSSGWADGLLALWAGCGFLLLAIFTAFLGDANNQQFVGIFFFFIIACIAMGLAADVASASSNCDTIKDTLNKKRANDLSVENDAKLYVLERLLQTLNKQIAAWLLLQYSGRHAVSASAYVVSFVRWAASSSGYRPGQGGLSQLPRPFPSPPPSSTG